MNKMKNNIAILMVVIFFLLVIYLLFSFIAWNLNPLNWWLFGRIIYATIAVVITIWGLDELD